MSNSIERLLRIREVSARTGLCRTVIYDEMAAGRFPKQIRLTAQSVAWRESEIDAWVAARIAASRRRDAA